MPRHLVFVTVTLGALACRTQTSLAPEAGTEVASPTQDSGPQPPPPVPRTAALEAVRDCADVTGVLRARAIATMNETLDRNLRNAKQSHRERCVPVYDAAVYPGAGGTSGSTGASSYSTTNNQVADVDEADFIKNDGRYIYIATGREFRIIDAWPAATARVIAKVPLSGAPLKLFVNADRAVVYTRDGSGAPRVECTYGYSCIPSGDGQPWSIQVFDITDRSQPLLLRRLTSSSSYLTARRVGTAVHSVLVRQAGQPSYPIWPADVVTCGGQLTDAQLDVAFARLRAQNTELLQQADQGGLPAISDTTYPRGGGAPTTTSNLLLGCDRFYSEGDPTSRTFTTVVSIDMTQETAPSVATIFSDPGAVYASAGALYMAVPQQQQANEGWFSGWESEPELTTIHKFNLNQASASYAASGLVKGRVLNQFAMDEHQAHLRVATTTGHPPSADVHSTLSVLKDGGDAALKEVGRLDRLAPTEDIRSVRFDGARGYLVTFKKTDPLFVLDLADPSKPRVEAELKIPGFSTYMHRMDDGHLLTIGYDAADQGDFAYFTGVLLQIFDVSDPQAPTLAHKQVIGTRGSSSEALTNHLAFNYFAPKAALLLPMTICDNVSGSIFAARPSFSGLIAFDTTTTTGFRERGRISFTPPEAVNCGNWWTNASSIVQRSIIMDDIVFSISATEIKASALDTLATPVATVRLND